MQNIHLNDQSKDQSTPSQVLDPTSIYSMSSNTNLKCDSKICTRTKTLSWVGKGTCQSNFVCVNLDGNICGDHGIRLKYQDQDEVNVCQPRVMYRKLLKSHEEVRVTFWTKNDHIQFNAKCFLWCTHDGQLPANVSSVGTWILI